MVDSSSQIFALSTKGFGMSLRSTPMSMVWRSFGEAGSQIIGMVDVVIGVGFLQKCYVLLSQYILPNFLIKKNTLADIFNIYHSYSIPVAARGSIIVLGTNLLFHIKKNQQAWKTKQRIFCIHSHIINPL